MPEEEEKPNAGGGRGGGETAAGRQHTNLQTSTRSSWSPSGLMHGRLDKTRYAVI